MPSDRVVLSLDEFRERVLRSAPIPDDVVLHKATTFRAKLIAGDPRAVQLTISDATVDRDADSLAVEGWDTGHYLRNPVVLFAHDYRQPPVAKATQVWVADAQLKAIDHFVEPAVYPFGDTIFQMVKGGYLNAASVGFLPLKYARVDPHSDRPDADRGERGGIDFERQELLEHSIVPVPSNPQALVEARSALKSADWSAYRNVLERYLDEDDPIAPRRIVERAWRHADPVQRTVVAASGTRGVQAALNGLLRPFKAAPPPPPTGDDLVRAAASPGCARDVLGRIGQIVDDAMRRATGRLPT